MPVRYLGLIPSLLALSVVACATSAPSDGPPDRAGQDTGIVRDLGGDDSVGPRDTGIPTDTGAPADTDRPDVAVLDIDFDTPGDTGAATDSGTDTARPDTGPCVGLGCPCTASTRSVVCGRLACVDGFCCESGCDGDCRGCDVPGSEGTCAFYSAGVDPDDDCSAQSAASCGRDGFCDGAGECRLYGAETSCNDAQACSVGDACDGAGTCRGEVPSTCGPGPGNVCCVGTCSDGAGCATEAAACADVCGATELTVGRDCAGCGAAGAEGVCVGGGTHRCDVANHNECQELTCGGVRYYCTNAGGTWGWRPTGSCDDGKACTYDDRCGGGACIGTTITCDDTVCAERECNGTSTCSVTPHTGASCSDGNACSYDDRCDASGVCVGGRTITCTDSPCIDRECTGGPTCSETILTGSTCSDGNSCSYGDTCSASGTCVAAGTVSCTGLDTACLAYSCNSTSTCASAPRNVGGVCDDGNASTDFDRCNASGVCVGDTGCPPPSEACVPGTQNRDGCGNARVISRIAAGSGWTISDTTCRASDRFDEPSGSGCWDANADHAYRLYMREGESASVRYRTGTACIGGAWDGTLKIIESDGCADRSCDNDNRVYCDEYVSSTTGATTYVARRDGWVVFVADGTTAFDDEGEYRLDVTLSCRAGNCGCL